MPLQTTSEVKTKYNLEMLNLPVLFEDVSRSYPEIPSAKEFNMFVKAELSGFGFSPGELIDLLQLLSSIFFYYFGTHGPHAQAEFVCDKMFNGDKCRMQIIRTERRRGKIYLWCGRGHETVLPIRK